jgi:hypothetical protein
VAVGSGCSGGDARSEATAEVTEAVCSSPDATSAAVATIAEVIGRELHRWELTTDFYKYTGYQNQLMLGLTATGLAQCGGSCPLTASLLALQDPRMDQKVVFGSQKLSAAAFASELTTGFDNQASCNATQQCPYEAHVLGTPFAASGGNCDLQLYTYSASAPGGGNLNNVANLDNALFWTAHNGPNPYIAFQSTTTSVTIDPTGGLSPLSPWLDAEICQKFSLSNINGTPCTCAANNVYSNGQLQNLHPQVPMTYFCVQAGDVCQKFSTTSLNGTPCTCAANNIYTGGVLKNAYPQVPMTYFCMRTSDLCQWQSAVDVTGTACTCAPSGISNGSLQASESLTPNIYYCKSN